MYVAKIVGYHECQSLTVGGRSTDRSEFRNLKRNS
jgi:hypothetical protein